MRAQNRNRLCITMFVAALWINGFGALPAFGKTAIQGKTGKVYVTQGIPAELVEHDGVPGGVPGGSVVKTDKNGIREDYKMEDELRDVLFASLPKYPPTALKKGMEGKVYVDVRFDRTGTVVEVKILKGPKIFADAVRNEVKQLKFRPMKYRSNAFYTFHFFIGD